MKKSLFELNKEMLVNDIDLLKRLNRQGEQYFKLYKLLIVRNKKLEDKIRSFTFWIVIGFIVGQIIVPIGIAIYNHAR